MCSISGFISSKPLAKDTCENLASALLYYGAERGDQSAGIFINGRVLKRAMSTKDFIATSEFSDMFVDSSSLCLLHTRQPTSGGLGDKQAQPFRVGETVTVHNGWFHNIQELKNQWTIKKKSGVDSELVARFVDSYGINLLPKFLSSSLGSSAFGIINKGDLYLMRDSNPIHVATLHLNSGNDVTVFASTSNMIMNSLRYNWLISNGLKINQIKEGILFKVSPDGDLKSLCDRVWAKHSYGGCGYGQGNFSRNHQGQLGSGNNNNYPHWWKENRKYDKDVEATYKAHKAIRESAREIRGPETDIATD